MGDFYGVGQENLHRQTFAVEADEPETRVGSDEAPNPVEHLLGSLASCLTGALVYHAALHGIELEEVSSTVEGDLDVRGFMGLADDVRKGYQEIRVAFHVKSDAPAEKLEELARFSPVLDTVTHGTRVELSVEKA